MKRILLALLVSLGLQLQAQSSCDSTMSYTVGSQYQLEVVFGVGGNTPSTWSAPIYAVTYGNGNILAEDSCFGQPCPHIIYNYNMLTGMPYDTLTTCVSYVASDSVGNLDTLWCCFDQYWNGQAWARVMMQQQSWCDSLTTQHYPVTGISITLTSIPSGVDSVEVLWTACNTTTCYYANGVTGYFPSISLSDTVKLCYDAWLYENNTMEVCSQCDSLIFDGTTWIMFSSQGNPLSINEQYLHPVGCGCCMSNKIYDMLGRELTEIPVGTMYIRNQKLYMQR